jgi:hypothetical protein
MRLSPNIVAATLDGSQPVAFEKLLDRLTGPLPRIHVKPRTSEGNAPPESVAV